MATNQPKMELKLPKNPIEALKMKYGGDLSKATEEERASAGMLPTQTIETTPLPEQTEPVEDEKGTKKEIIKEKEKKRGLFQKLSDKKKGKKLTMEQMRMIGIALRESWKGDETAKKKTGYKDMTDTDKKVYSILKLQYPDQEVSVDSDEGDLVRAHIAGYPTGVPWLDDKLKKETKKKETKKKETKMSAGDQKIYSTLKTIFPDEEPDMNGEKAHELRAYKDGAIGAPDWLKPHLPKKELKKEKEKKQTKAEIHEGKMKDDSIYAMEHYTTYADEELEPKLDEIWDAYAEQYPDMSEEEINDLMHNDPSAKQYIKKAHGIIDKLHEHGHLKDFIVSLVMRGDLDKGGVILRYLKEKGYIDLNSIQLPGGGTFSPDYVEPEEGEEEDKWFWEDIIDWWNS